MMYDEVVRDFALRTQKNLGAIDRLRAQGENVYEVTQLVNSTLGLLVFPQQKYVQKIPKTPLSQLAADGWPVPRVTGTFSQVTNLNELIRYLRNAIAHFNVEFIGNGNNEIHGLRVWNARKNNTIKTWEAELSVDDLRKLADCFVKMLLRGFVE